MILETEKFRVNADGHWLSFSIPILQAKMIEEKIAVIFDYMSYPNGRPASNLIAFDKEGNELWKAENPSNSPTDAFVNFQEGDGLQVGNFAGYNCKLDPETGKLIDAVFTK